jgi:ATPase family protein associated with various cellular activities (AAA)
VSRSDLVISLVKAGATGDQGLLRTTVEALAAEERAKQHHQLADRLVENLHGAKRAPQDIPRTFDGGHGGLLFQIEAQRPFESLILPGAVERACRELVEEHHRADLLRSYQLEPRHRVLLVGPPGNGKTSLAEALAHSLAVPLFTVRYEAVVGSYLGETSSRLRRLFDFARTHACVLFFDEFDTLGKERGDAHETGEVKRVVSSLLLQIDSLPSYVIVVTATNHPELLDRAVWRRFQMRLELPAPGPKQIRLWLERFETQLGRPLGAGHGDLIRRLRPSSYSELEDFSLDVRRRLVLSGSDADLGRIVRERLAEWSARFRPKGNLTAKTRGRT